MSDKIIVFDFERGIITPFNEYYIISGDEFMIYNNDRDIHINYSYGNVSILKEKTIDRLIILNVVNNAHLIIKNNTGVELFNFVILERNAANIWNYGLGRYFNNDLIIAPVSVCFGLLTAGTQLLYHFKRVK